MDAIDRANEQLSRDGYSFWRDRMGGGNLMRGRDNASCYFQPGDDATEAEERLVGPSGMVDPTTADLYLEGAETY